MDDRNGSTASVRGVAVVTGASAGIGRATAVELARHGYDVGLLSRGEAGLRAAVDDVLAHGGRAVAVQADVTDWAATERAAREVEERLGPIDVWVNNAIATVFGPVWTLTAAEVSAATAVTYLGQVHGTLAALARMRPRDRGTIVSVGCAVGLRPAAGQATSAAAKAATSAFMDALRVDLLREDSAIRVTQVILPTIDTPQFGWSRRKVARPTASNRPAYPAASAARAIVDAATTAPRRRVVGPWTRLILVLNKVMPGVLDHAAALRDPVDGSSPPQAAVPEVGNLDAALDQLPGDEAGPDGVFSQFAHGVLDPGFVRSIPSRGRLLARATRARAGEIVGYLTS